MRRNEIFERITIRVPETLVDQYRKQATDNSQTLEECLAVKLKQAVAMTDSQPIYLGDQQRKELSSIAGKLISTPDDLISWAKQIASIKVANVDIPLREQLVKRLDSRRFGKTWPELMKSMVTEGLEQAVGLR